MITDLHRTKKVLYCPIIYTWQYYLRLHLSSHFLDVS